MNGNSFTLDVAEPVLLVEAKPTGPHEWSSDYVSQWWLPVIGPSGFLLHQRLAGWVGEVDYPVSLVDVCATIGLSPSHARGVVRRLVEFRMLDPTEAGRIGVRMMLPDLSPALHARVLDRCPQYRPATG